MAKKRFSKEVQVGKTPMGYYVQIKEKDLVTGKSYYSVKGEILSEEKADELSIKE